ncbi:hypothetical protein STEG23_030620, partial [Scotinomys teguina]
MQPGRTTNTGGGTMEVKAAAPRCQLLLILLMSAVMLLPGTNSSLLLVQTTWDKRFTAACSENSHQDHRVTRNHRQRDTYTPVLIAVVLFTIARKWSQPHRSSAEESVMKAAQ